MRCLLLLPVALPLASCDNLRGPDFSCDFDDWTPPDPPPREEVATAKTASPMAPAHSCLGVPRGPAPRYLRTIAITQDSALLVWPHHPKAAGYTFYRFHHGTYLSRPLPGLSLWADSVQVVDGEVRHWKPCPRDSIDSPPQCWEGSQPALWGVAYVWWDPERSKTETAWTPQTPAREALPPSVWVQPPGRGGLSREVWLTRVAPPTGLVPCADQTIEGSPPGPHTRPGAQSMPAIMAEASDPVLIQLGGIAQGMSGSPLFSEEGTWGAIAYSLNNQDSAPYYCFATPIEWVIGERGAAPVARPAATWGGAAIVPLEVLRVVTGLNSGSPWAGALPATLTQERQESFEAGRPLAVASLLGEITGGAIGTISYVDGDRVYGFGHPMDQFGSVELPIIEARVLAEVSNLAAPHKLASLNPTVRGTLTEDRLPAVRGVLDDGPELVPVRSVLTLPSGDIELVHRMPTSVPQAGLVSLAAFRPLFQRVDNEADHSLRVAVEVSFVETDSMLDRSRLYAGPEDRLFSLISQAEADLGDALQQLLQRDDYTLRVREAEVRVEVLPEARFAKVTGVDADTVVAPGDGLTVTTSLRVGRRSDREIDLDLSLPDTLVPGAYLVEAGPAVLLDDPDDADLGAFFGDFFGAPDLDTEETLEDVFVRVNEEDRSVLLKARLTPLLEEPGLEGEGVTGVGPGPAGESAMVSTREAVGLVLTGVASTRVRGGVTEIGLEPWPSCRAERREDGLVEP